MYTNNKVSTHGISGLTGREFKTLLKHFISDKTSMRICIFLIINFLFMFVELIWGFYTNSLGLISDAGHMLFDCTALGIGLYASFVSKIKANGTYTYGYGRYELISGYVNGIFLLFIGYFIFVESIERLFKTPEITTDSLVLVAVLGLGVNLIGLFFFHDHGNIQDQCIFFFSLCFFF
jgi:zinc transporter 5/7